MYQSSSFSTMAVNSLCIFVHPNLLFNRTPYEKSPHATLATLNDSSTNHSPWYFCSTSEVTSM